MNMVEILKIAEIAHEVNRSYCECMGFNVLPEFNKLPTNIRLSIIDGVIFSIQNPSSIPSDFHNNWMKFKVKEGWIYGEIRDDSKKIHNLLVPYDQLPKEHQAKDYIFSTIVKQLHKLL